MFEISLFPKNAVPNTTILQDNIQLQIDNGLEQLKKHKEMCPSNATYLSLVTIADFLTYVSTHINEITCLKKMKKLIDLEA